MGSYHARLLLEGRVPRATLTAVADVDAAQLARHATVRGFADSRELIRSGLVDAVLIATPHYAHTTIGCDALQQGLHVLTEKPVSVHKADCERLVAAHTNPRQVFAAMLNQRTNPAYRQIREWVHTGALGELRRINWTITDWFRTDAYYASGGWRATWAGEGGGVLLNQATHNLDLWQWLFGMPVRVRAVCGFGRYHTIEVEDDVTAVLEYANGATGVFVTTTGEAPGTNRLEVVGDLGRVVHTGDQLVFTRNTVSTTDFLRQSSKHYELPPHTEQAFSFPNPGGQHLEVLQNFVAAILDGTPLIAPAVTGGGAVELANAMIWSASRGAAIALPLDAAGYEQHLQQRRKTSRFTKPPARKQHDEVAPYLVKEN
ncbi:MAG: Myo-inositol 2-dehydrogenase [Verrucomicrobiae bacterium]|nr:Myo-inositol 2-dehydrogenase [Verrucomicrobiae bacterium]